jgi:hypothetical protein
MLQIGQQFASQDRALRPWQVEVLSRSLPKTAKIRVSGRVEFHQVLEQFPDYSFLPGTQKEIVEDLVRGEIDAGFTYDPINLWDDTYANFRLPFEYDHSLLVDNSRDVLLKNLSTYGAKLEFKGENVTLEMQESGLIRKIDPSLTRIYIPVIRSAASNESHKLQVHFPIPLEEKDLPTIICAGEALSREWSGDTLVSQLPENFFASSQAYQVCLLKYPHVEFADQYPSSSLKVRIDSSP